MRARGGGRTLLLCGHLDTVGPGTMEAPFEPRIDDRLHGRGAYDMKAGVAAALVACRDAAALDLAGRVVVAAVADEEHASLGVQEVPATVGADAAIVTEPTELEIAIAHKGFAWLEIEVQGRAAHGSLPPARRTRSSRPVPCLPRSASSTSAWARAVTRCWDAARACLAHPRRARSRHLPGELHDRHRAQDTAGRGAAEVERELARLLAGCREADLRLEDFRHTLLVREPLETGEDEPVVTALARGGGQVLGSRPPLSGASFWADSAFIAGAGIPTALFGPGGEGAHAAEEVSIRDIESCARAADPDRERLLRLSSHPVPQHG